MYIGVRQEERLGQQFRREFDDFVGRVSRAGHVAKRVEIEHFPPHRSQFELIYPLPFAATVDVTIDCPYNDAATIPAPAMFRVPLPETERAPQWTALLAMQRE
jgi:hypothetical protein